MLNYIENYLILASAVTGCVSISGFISLFSIPVGNTLSVIGLEIEQRLKELKSIGQ